MFSALCSMFYVLDSLEIRANPHNPRHQCSIKSFLQEKENNRQNRNQPQQDFFKPKLQFVALREAVFLVLFEIICCNNGYRRNGENKFSSGFLRGTEGNEKRDQGNVKQ